MPGMKPKEGVNGEEMETEWRANFYVRCFKEARSDRGLYEPSQEQYKNSVTCETKQEPSQNSVTHFLITQPNHSVQGLILDFRKTRIHANSQFQITGPGCPRLKFIWATFPMTLARGKLIFVEVEMRLDCPFLDMTRGEITFHISCVFFNRKIVGQGQICECW